MHGVHTALDDPPALVLKPFTSAHERHAESDDAPRTSEKYPWGHSLQDVAPPSFENVPAPQDVHDPPTQRVPVGHTSQTLEDGAKTVPGLHAAHPASSLNAPTPTPILPTGQSRHADMPADG
jgi:hypothetical protein